MKFPLRYGLATLIMSILLNSLLSNTVLAYDHYKRCWLQQGNITLNCDPADGYVYKKENNLYKKCLVMSGFLQKKCENKDGYGVFYNHHFWYQCPVQQGKKSAFCNLANGYHVIKYPL